MHIYIPIAFLSVTTLCGVVGFAVMTYKLREHQANGNEEYAKDVAKVRAQWTGAFGLLIFGQLLGLIAQFLR